MSFRSWSFSPRSVGKEHLAAVFVQNLALDPCHPDARQRRELHDEQFGTVGLESAGLTDGKLRRGDAQVVASAPGAWPLRDAARLDGSGQPAVLVAVVKASYAVVPSGGHALRRLGNRVSHRPFHKNKVAVGAWNCIRTRWPHPFTLWSVNDHPSQAKSNQGQPFCSFTPTSK